MIESQSKINTNSEQLKLNQISEWNKVECLPPLA